MTPTLFGRWQTRFLMLLTIGLIVAAVFWLIYRSPVFFYVVAYVFLFGLVWDVAYSLLQKLRWDRDWPSAFVFFAGVLEGVVLYLVIALVGLPGIERGSIPTSTFFLQYLITWLLIFLFIEGPMRAIFPFWRFHGGVIVPAVPAARRR